MLQKKARRGVRTISVGTSRPQRPFSGPEVKHDRSPPLRTIPPKPQHEIPVPAGSTTPDPVVKTSKASVAALTAGQNRIRTRIGIRAGATKAPGEQRPRFRIPIFTFVTDERVYRELRASFEQAGFDEDHAMFVVLTGSGERGQAEPYATISRLVSTRTEPYFVLCHQDIRLDQGHDLASFVRAVEHLDLIDPLWAVAGDAGGSRRFELVRSVTDPHGSRTAHDLPARVDSLDENFLVLRTQTGITCSSSLHGFHFYAADFCLNAELRGRTAYVIDFHVHHLSGGRRTPEFYAAKDSFDERWRREFRARYFRSSTEVHLFSRSRLLSRTLGAAKVRHALKRYKRLGYIASACLSWGRAHHTSGS